MGGRGVIGGHDPDVRVAMFTGSYRGIDGIGDELAVWGDARNLDALEIGDVGWLDGCFLSMQSGRHGCCQRG
jgi:hypothetical protein